MRLEQLEAFCAAVRAGSISGGARRLGLTQAAASQRIKMLETDLGTQLLQRSPAGIVPTPAGEEVLHTALKALDLIHRLDSGPPGRRAAASILRVGATPVLGGYALPHALLALRALMPDLPVNLKVGHLGELLGHLEEGTLHLLFAEGPLEHPGFRTLTLGRDQLRLVAAASDLWSVRPDLSVQEWLALPHFLFPAGCGLRRALTAAMVAAGLPPDGLQVRAEVNGLEALTSLVEEGLGVTWLPRRAVRRGLQAGTLQLLDVQGFRVEYPYVALVRAGLAQPAAGRLVSLTADLLDHRRAARRRRQLA